MRFPKKQYVAELKQFLKRAELEIDIYQGLLKHLPHNADRYHVVLANYEEKVDAVYDELVRIGARKGGGW